MSTSAISGVLDGAKARAKDLLTCPLCAQQYEDPRILPCQHAFCCRCLQLHLDLLQKVDAGARAGTTSTAVSSSTTHRPRPMARGSFTCPACGKEIGVPSGGADAFPVDNRIQRIRELVVEEMARDLSKRLGRSMSSPSKAAAATVVNRSGKSATGTTAATATRLNDIRGGADFEDNEDECDDFLDDDRFYSSTYGLNSDRFSRNRPGYSSLRDTRRRRNRTTLNDDTPLSSGDNFSRLRNTPSTGTAASSGLRGDSANASNRWSWASDMRSEPAKPAQTPTSRSSTSTSSFRASNDDDDDSYTPIIGRHRFQLGSSSLRERRRRGIFEPEKVFNGFTDGISDGSAADPTSNGGSSAGLDRWRRRHYDGNDKATDSRQQQQTDGFASSRLGDGGSPLRDRRYASNIDFTTTTAEDTLDRSGSAASTNGSRFSSRNFNGNGVFENAAMDSRQRSKINTDDRSSSVDEPAASLSPTTGRRTKNTPRSGPDTPGVGKTAGSSLLDGLRHIMTSAGSRNAPSSSTKESTPSSSGKYATQAKDATDPKHTKSGTGTVTAGVPPLNNGDVSPPGRRGVNSGPSLPPVAEEYGSLGRRGSASAAAAKAGKTSSSQAESPSPTRKNSDSSPSPTKKTSSFFSKLTKFRQKRSTSQSSAGSDDGPTVDGLVSPQTPDAVPTVKDDASLDSKTEDSRWGFNIGGRLSASKSRPHAKSSLSLFTDTESSASETGTAKGNVDVGVSSCKDDNNNFRSASDQSSTRHEKENTAAMADLTSCHDVQQCVDGGSRGTTSPTSTEMNVSDQVGSGSSVGYMQRHRESDLKREGSNEETEPDMDRSGPRNSVMDSTRGSQSDKIAPRNIEDLSSGSGMSSHVESATGDDITTNQQQISPSQVACDSVQNTESLPTNCDVDVAYNPLDVNDDFPDIEIETALSELDSVTFSTAAESNAEGMSSFQASDVIKNHPICTEPLHSTPKPQKENVDITFDESDAAKHVGSESPLPRFGSNANVDAGQSRSFASNRNINSRKNNEHTGPSCTLVQSEMSTCDDDVTSTAKTEKLNRSHDNNSRNYRTPNSHQERPCGSQSPKMSTGHVTDENANHCTNIDDVISNGVHNRGSDDDVNGNSEDSDACFVMATGVTSLADGSVVVADYGAGSLCILSPCNGDDNSRSHSTSSKINGFKLSAKKVPTPEINCRMDGLKPFSVAASNVPSLSPEVCRLYVGDRRRKTISVFDGYLSDVAQWPDKTVDWVCGVAEMNYSADETGTGSAGLVIVIDRAQPRHQLLAFTADGRLVAEMGAGGSSYGSYGGSESDLCMAEFVTVDHFRNRLLVADSGNHCLKVFDVRVGSKSVGRLVAGRRGTGVDGEMQWPKGLAIDERTDVIFVADSRNGRVLAFSGSDGRCLGTAVDELRGPYAVTVVRPQNTSTSKTRLAVTTCAVGGRSQLKLYDVIV